MKNQLVNVNESLVFSKPALNVSFNIYRIISSFEIIPDSLHQIST